MSDHTDETDANDDMSGRGRPVLVKDLLEILRCPAVVAFIFLFIFQLGGVNGPSMLPSLDDDTIYIGARWAKPDYQDIVAINSSALGEPIIKRVIGLPGDTLRIEDGIIYRNGQALDEPYVENRGYSNLPELVVPAHTLFVLGDNRLVSLDSSSPALGPVPENEVVSVVLFHFRFPFGGNFFK